MTQRTDWFSAAKTGVFLHYLAAIGHDFHRGDKLMPADDWNRRVNSVDVDRLARDLAGTGMGYVFLTIGQITGHYCSPNATYDGLVDRQPSLCSERDLVAELAAALAARGVPLLVYLPSHAPSYDRRAVEALACTPAWDASRWQLRPGTYLQVPDVDDRLTTFQRNWEAIIREWSMRWSAQVRGWWLDGCYFADTMYRHDDEPNFGSFAAALRAGNPNAIVGFNAGVKVPVQSVTDHEDFTGGEISTALPVWNRWNTPTRWCDGKQYHLLSYLGNTWMGGDRPRFADDLAAAYTEHVTSAGAVVSWDVPIGGNGTVTEPFLRQLTAIAKRVRV